MAQTLYPDTSQVTASSGLMYTPVTECPQQFVYSHTEYETNPDTEPSLTSVFGVTHVTEMIITDEKGEREVTEQQYQKWIVSNNSVERSVSLIKESPFDTHKLRQRFNDAKRSPLFVAMARFVTDNGESLSITNQEIKAIIQYQTFEWCRRGTFTASDIVAKYDTQSLEAFWKYIESAAVKYTKFKSHTTVDTIPDTLYRAALPLEPGQSPSLGTHFGDRAVISVTSNDANLDEMHPLYRHSMGNGGNRGFIYEMKNIRRNIKQRSIFILNYSELTGRISSRDSGYILVNAQSNGVPIATGSHRIFQSRMVIVCERYNLNYESRWIQSFFSPQNNNRSIHANNFMYDFMGVIQRPPVSLRDYHVQLGIFPNEMEQKNDETEIEGSQIFGNNALNSYGFQS